MEGLAQAHLGMQQQEEAQPQAEPQELPPPPVPQLSQPEDLQGQRPLQITPRPRWKPYPAQVSVMEAHFQAGYTKPTPELVAAVQRIGTGSHQQVQVWLKNRLARSKRDPQTMPHHVHHQQVHDFASTGEAAAALHTLGLPPNGGVATSPTESDSPRTKRLRVTPPEPRESAESEFSAIAQGAMEDLANVMSSVEVGSLDVMRGMLRTARRVCCYGVGREGLVMKAFAMRLYHLGIQASAVGETTTPPIGSGDVLIVSAGPGYFSSVQALATEARRTGAKVVAFTAHLTAALPMADTVVRVPSQTMGTLMAAPQLPNGHNGVHTGQPGQSPLQLGAPYELALQLLCDCFCVVLQHDLGVLDQALAGRHTNLE
ncbi:hypothetical protein WJX72_001168 [[Myrmecia] bisecta]|uniref:Homeobox domain-containing protein n=1 Tax=[Myrmecia] bisecta TaxID=41462 RepID=A0AAW1PMR1_9CHLO